MFRIWTKRALALLICAIPSAFGQSPTYESILEKSSQYQALGDFEAYALTFLKSPYNANGPLGEGKSADFDRDPLYRFDSFDCTTLVETVLALGRTHNFRDFIKELQKIRYKAGEISYFTRNHFTEIDWTPNNSALLENVTDLISQALSFKNAAETPARIDKTAWFEEKTSAHLIRPDLSDAQKEEFLANWRQTIPQQPVNYLNINYLDHETLADPRLDSVLKALSSPSGVYVVNVVRPFRTQTTDYVITHQAIAFTRNHIPEGPTQREETQVYHASLDYKEVVRQSLKDFVGTRIKKSRSLGLQFLRLRQ